MLFLKILGGLLLALLILLLCPVRVEVTFREEFTATLRYLFLKFPLAPGKQEPKPAPEEPPPEKEEPEKKSDPLGMLKNILKQTGLSGFLKALGDLVKLLARSAKRLLHHLKWKRFDLYLCVGGGEDAAQGAILFGQLSAAVYSAVGALFSLTPCERKAVSVDLDYNASENSVDFSAKLSLLPIFALREVGSLLIHALPIALKLVRAAKGPAPKKTPALSQPETPIISEKKGERT